MIETEVEKKLKTKIGILAILALISFPIIMFYNAFVLSYLWFWFLVPLGVLPIGMAHGMGIIVLKNLLTAVYKTDNSETESLQSKADTLEKRIMFMYALPTFALLVGYIFHSFM